MLRDDQGNLVRNWHVVLLANPFQSPYFLRIVFVSDRTISVRNTNSNPILIVGSSNMK